MGNLENRYFEGLATRAYFDIYSHQFKCIKIEKKLLNLALYTKAGGELNYLIIRYKEDKGELILSCLNTTLLYYIDYLRTGEPMTILSSILSKNLSESDLVLLLEKELKARLIKDIYLSGDYSEFNETYKVSIGGFNIEKYISIKDISKEEMLDLIVNGE